MDLIFGLAAVLAVVGLGVNTVRQMPDQQAKTLRDGLIGSAAGLLVGYGIGRFRPSSTSRPRRRAAASSARLNRP